ncbi:MAG: hypothetical protein QGI83_07245, partial [Candidatus Latescibacteria bacterium]|nr:hypothetical protein [Candidatus Latescibacterota bacterium]
MSETIVEDEALEALVRAASEKTAGSERMAAVAQLRTARLGQRQAHVLCDMAQSAPQAAWRAAAAQVLGHHRAASSFPEIRNVLAGHARKEPDLVVQKALAYALRDTDGILPLLDLSHPAAVVEAALGAPSTEAGWQAVLDRFFRGGDTRIDEAVLGRIRLDPEGPPQTLAYLLEADFPESHADLEERVSRLLGTLDQGTVFEALAE